MQILTMPHTIYFYGTLILTYFNTFFCKIIMLPFRLFLGAPSRVLVDVGATTVTSQNSLFSAQHKIN